MYLTPLILSNKSKAYSIFSTLVFNLASEKNAMILPVATISPVLPVAAIPAPKELTCAFELVVKPPVVP